MKRRKSKPLLDAPLPFTYDVVPDEKAPVFTPRAGLPLVIEQMRSLGVAGAVRTSLHLRRHNATYNEAMMVESAVLLIAAGGDCMEDMNALRKDAALTQMLGYSSLPSTDTLRAFLQEFHDDACMKRAQAALSPGEKARMVPESEALIALGNVQAHLVHELCARHPKVTVATLEADATIIESTKAEALPHYKGGRGYQPVAVYWNEMDLIVADEFRDGNVPAGKAPLDAVRRGFEALPATIMTRRFRGDSAFYETETLRWLMDPAHHIARFTISADMVSELRALCVALPASSWKLLETRKHEQVYWSEVAYVTGNWPRDAKPLRTIVLRFDPSQGELFAADGSPRDTRYLSIVTNDEEMAGDALIRWHWQKAGSIEKVHDVTKNDLAAGTLPCAEFGANAAWYRLNMLTYNVLSALKTLSLPPEFQDARPKRLRFLVFAIGAELISHARRLYARLSEGVASVVDLLATWHRARHRPEAALTAPSG
jgi:hypothetical protein